MLDSSLHLVQRMNQIIYSPLGDPISVPLGSYVLTCPNAEIALPIVQLVWCLRLGWTVLFAIFISRYFFQVFGNIDVFENTFFAFIFRVSRPLNRLFMGILPCVYGVDIGIFVTYYLFDLVDKFLIHIVIMDQAGIFYK
jgi:uncharacterized protein YggT (Ycf19 family)